MTTTIARMSSPPRAPRTPLLLTIPVPRAPAPAMPDVFVFAPDGESSFCAFSSAAQKRVRGGDDNDDEEEPSPSSSAPDFAELDRNLDFLAKGAEELSPQRRSRLGRAAQEQHRDVLSWLHGVDEQESGDADGDADRGEDLVKARVPVSVCVRDDDSLSPPSTPRASSPPPPPSPPQQHTPTGGLRKKASLALMRALNAGKTVSSPPPRPPSEARTLALRQTAPRASSSTWDLVLPPSPPANTDAFNLWETPRPRTRIFSSLFSSTSTHPAAEKPIRPTKPSLFKRPKKTTQPDLHLMNRDHAAKGSSPKAKVDSPAAHTPKQPLRRRPFSSLILRSHAEKSTVDFPIGKRSSESERLQSPASRQTKNSAFTAISSASTPYGDPDTASSASSSVTTLGNELVTPVVPSSPHGFHTKRLDSLHFDSTIFWDPSSYTFTMQ